MLFGVDDFVDQFLQWTMLTAAVLTGVAAIAMILHHRWTEFWHPDSPHNEPQPIPLHVRKTMARSDLWSSR